MSHRRQFGMRAKAVISSILFILTVSALALSACGSSSAAKPKSTASPNSARRGFKFEVVADGPTSDPFWILVKKGADQAAKDMGVIVTYQNPTTTDVSAVGSLIDTAVASQPDGMVVAIPDCTQLTPHIQQALLVGIPIISIQSGSACASTLGLLNYIGQTDYQSGLEAGQKLASAGVHHLLCVNPQVGDTDLDSRCQGASDSMKKAHGKTDVLGVNLSNPGSVQQKIKSLLAQDPSIDGVITLNAAGAAVAIAATQNLIRAQPFFLATFDTSPTILQSVEQGHMLFAIDQQPYLQGYLSIVLLTLYKSNLDMVVDPALTTGPIFVTTANVAQIKQLENSGSR